MLAASPLKTLLQSTLPKPSLYPSIIFPKQAILLYLEPFMKGSLL